MLTLGEGHSLKRAGEGPVMRMNRMTSVVSGFARTLAAIRPLFDISSSLLCRALAHARGLM